MFCNDLNMNHCVETGCETNKEQRDAVLCHALNGLCILQPGVALCRSFGRDLSSVLVLLSNFMDILLPRNWDDCFIFLKVPLVNVL